MLKFITWHQYLIAVLSLGTLYYTIVLLRFYHLELAAFFNRKPDEQSTFLSEQQEYPSILGEIHQDPDDSLILSEDLQFTQSNDSDENEEN